MQRTPRACDDPPVIDPLERWREYGEKPDYAGPVSFGGAPYTQDPGAALRASTSRSSARRPTTSSPTGRARASARARSASASCPPGPHLEAKIDAFAELRIVDYGDAPVLPADPARTHAAIEETVGEVLDAGLIPIVLGGDHSIAEPDMRACASGTGRSGSSTSTRTPTRARGVRRRGLARDADVPARARRARRPDALRADRAARLLAGRARVRLAARAGHHVVLHARRARSRHRRHRRANGRRSSATGRRASSPSTSTCSIPRSRRAPARRSPAG